MRLFVSLALAFLIALPASTFAQQTESRILGKVVDQSQGALPGVTVTITSRTNGGVRTVVTDGDGSYIVTNLAPGAYLVQVELSGFQTKTREVVLGVAQVEHIEVELRLAHRPRLDSESGSAVHRRSISSDRSETMRSAPARRSASA